MFDVILEFIISISTLELSKFNMLKFSKLLLEMIILLEVFIVTFVIPHSFLKLDR